MSKQCIVLYDERLVHLSASECLKSKSFRQSNVSLLHGTASSPSPVGEDSVTICGTDRCPSASCSASSSPSPNGVRAHGEMGNPSAADGGGGAGGGAVVRRCDRRCGC